LDDNIKIDINETIFLFGLVSSLQQGQSEIFGNVNEVNLHINNNLLKNFAIGTF
jgi:hypothetical protein